MWPPHGLSSGQQYHNHPIIPPPQWNGFIILLISFLWKEKFRVNVSYKYQGTTLKAISEYL
jgi:hypothetical protein